MPVKIGLIVNPVAGMGGSVGLKGTDGADLYQEALKRGAEPVTPRITREFLIHIAHIDKLEFMAAPGLMGEAFLAHLQVDYHVIGSITDQTSPEDTRQIVREMVENGAELVIFVGGDGTARDVCDVVGTRIPVVAVPAGVKMFSAAFATNPRTAAELVDAFVEGAETTEEEVLDIDEEDYRNNRLSSHLYGYLRVPRVQALLQPGKIASSQESSPELARQEIAAYIIEKMEPGTLYFLGPGTTVRAITDALELPKTLLGVDAVYNGERVGEDLNEKSILSLMGQYPHRKIIVSPLGGNGFIFGRGNKQFTPMVIRKVGRENIQVISTEKKLRDLECLRVDTGDFELDKLLSGYMKVIVDYMRMKVIKVKC
jgi:predicted polyphosphate/ATP-dependent NAD kinase